MKIISLKLRHLAMLVYLEDKINTSVEAIENLHQPIPSEVEKKILITLPVFNEEDVIEKNVEIIRNFLINNIVGNSQILIVDNGSVDSTLEKSKKLSEKYQNVNYIHIDEKGRGRALKKAWSEINADIFSYMDIDLSTDLDAFPELINAIDEGYDIAIGSRCIKNSHVNRSLIREIFSRGYNILLKLFFNVKFHDAQCGFKAINRKVVEEIIPIVKDNEWFFDTEMLIKAERKGFKIKEIPVYWKEDRIRRSKLNIPKTIIGTIKFISGLRFNN